MSSVFHSIMSGLNEIIEDTQRDQRVVTDTPVQSYTPDEVKKVQNATGMSQKAMEIDCNFTKDFSCVSAGENTTKA